MDKQEWHLRKNCSLTPRQLGIAYGVQCLLTFSIALICTLHGAWQVFIFSGIEMLALATALIIYSRHATDHEHIALMDGYLLIEKVEAGKVEIIHLDPHWTRILQPERYQDLIGLISNGKKIEIGRFISGNKRKHLARELQHQLQYVG